MKRLLLGLLFTTLSAQAQELGRLSDSPIESRYSGAAAPLGEKDFLELFQEEVRVVTSSRQRQALREAPATVYVVTGEEIRSSGVQTLWDALRSVPGVDVIAARTADAHVAIRGFNGAISNRVLVLLDGKTLLNDFLGIVWWSEIPVSLEQIDRIEIVEGPASALYGANALSGVINIITKAPESLSGGVVTYAGGERNFHRASALYGDRKAGLAYKIDLGGETVNRFEDSNRLAGKVQRAHGLISYDFQEKMTLSLSGGLSDRQIEQTVGSSGKPTPVGVTGFLRGDLTREATKLRLLWNSSKYYVYDYVTPAPAPGLDSQIYDLSLEHFLSLPLENGLTVGGSIRRASTSSGLFIPGTLTQDLWSLFFEDRWDPHDLWSVIASARIDRHPFTGVRFSPRGSVIFKPSAEHVLRVSGGIAFRNPTSVENYLHLVSVKPAALGPITATRSTLDGSTTLRAEKLDGYELAHTGRFDRVKSNAAVFYYQAQNLIDNKPLFVRTCAGAGCVPTLTLLGNFVAIDTPLHAYGGELAGEILINRQATAFANYSYQQLVNSSGKFVQESPKHKVNGGLRYSRSGLSASLWGNYVSNTAFIQDAFGAAVETYAKVPEYWLLHGHLGYSFSRGSWKGLELAVSAFNLLNRRHFELLGPQSGTLPGKFGEIVGGRWTGTISYRF